MTTVYSIYKITNKVNKKAYIGFTSREISRRFTEHATPSGVCGVSKAIRKYGKENFTIEIIYQSYDHQHTIDVMEPYFIKEYNTYLGEGYNETPGGERRCGEDHPMFGKKHSAETKKKMSIAALNREPHSADSNKRKGKSGDDNVSKRPDVKKKISEAVSGERNGMYGKKHTPEAILKMKAALTGRKHTEETKRKIKEANMKRAKPPKKPCPHCSKMVDPLNYKKWHGDNCSNKS